MKERTYYFLVGLNPSLNEVRGCILSFKPLPDIDEIFVEFHREEHRKSIMLNSNSSQPLESTTMSAKPFDDRSKKLATWCEYCRKPYHTKAKCWKLHRKHTDWLPKHLRDKEASCNLVATKTKSAQLHESSPFIKAPLEHLSKLLSSSNSTSFMSHSSNIHCSLIAFSYERWILDSGASSHMTGSLHLFTTYSPSTTHGTIKIANDSILNILVTGSMNISPSLCLQDVLYIPGTCNLLSINKITLDPHCNVVFSPLVCQFQDHISKRVIGSAKESSGLYYFLQSISSSNKQQTTLRRSTSLTMCKKKFFYIIV